MTNCLFFNMASHPILIMIVITQGQFGVSTIASTSAVLRFKLATLL
jgi:hypothetical protein